MAERFTGRVQREVLGITVAGHRDLERLLAGFNSAYDARRQRVLDGRSPGEVVRERLARDRSLANPGYHPPPDPCVLPKAMLVVARAKDVSQPDTYRFRPKPIAGAARNATKPGRGTQEAWTLHAGPGWSRERLEREPGAVGPLLLEAFGEAVGRPLPDPLPYL